MTKKKRGRPRKTNPLDHIAWCRFSQKEYNQARMLANIYAEGNLCRWIRYAALNADRKFLKRLP